MNTKVAPFTGAWIEISVLIIAWFNGGGSHPSRVRGLKYRQADVTDATIYRRTLHGCVD